MNENLNLVEILKDCPKGIELYSPMYGLGILTKVTNRIHVKFPKEHNVKCFRPDGKISEDGEIMLFPEDKTSWEGFQRPFVDGDVVFSGRNLISIYKKESGNSLCSYVSLNNDTSLFRNGNMWTLKNIRLATEEEKQKLFDAIKANGYKWNPETKTLEKLIVPKFKIGDKIRHRLTGAVYKVLFVLSNGCGGEVYDVAITNEIGKSIDIKEQDNYELAPNKFDPKTLQPFDKVLVRQYNEHWHIQFFETIHEYNKKYPFMCLGGKIYSFCIPYIGNEHLLDTVNEPSEFYRYWED